MINTKTAVIVLWMTLTCFVIFGTFILNIQVQDLETELARVNQNIQTDIKSIHVLKAEWSHLNTPSRLKKLASEHISLNKAKAEQIINYSALPFNYENGENDKIMTAGVNKKEYKKLVKAER